MTNRNRAARSEGLCVAHPIQVKRSEFTRHLQAGSEATVDCEVRKCTMRVAECQRCSRFKRVEVHEGAYVVLCRAPTDNAEDRR